MSDAGQEFTPDGYRELITEFLARDYKAVSFADGNPKSRNIILRHDIDMEMAAALSIAEIEAKLRVSATYFVLPTSELYNPLAPAAINASREIVALGHDIGLHFDASLISSESELEEAVKQQAKWIESASGRAVTVLSYHRPAPNRVGASTSIDGLLNAYDPRFVNEFAYVSDSRGLWRFGHPLDHPSVAAGSGIQLATHPIWWATNEVAPQAKLEKFLDRRSEVLEQELSENCQSFTPQNRQRGRPE
jgi:hypothetical protein